MSSLRTWAEATVLVVSEERELRWTGHLLFDWLFRAEHFHVIEARSASLVTFRQGEIFSGALAGLVRLVLLRRGPLVYRAVNAALKRRAEDGR